MKEERELQDLSSNGRDFAIATCTSAIYCKEMIVQSIGVIKMKLKLCIFHLQQNVDSVWLGERHPNTDRRTSSPIMELLNASHNVAPWKGRDKDSIIKHDEMNFRRVSLFSVGPCNLNLTLNSVAISFLFKWWKEVVSLIWGDRVFFSHVLYDLMRIDIRRKRFILVTD